MRRFAHNSQTRQAPLLGQGGVAAERTGWFVQLPINRWIGRTAFLMLRAVALALRARLRPLRKLRDIFLMAHPPRLDQGLLPNYFRSHRRDLGGDLNHESKNRTGFQNPLHAIRSDWGLG